MKTPDLTSGRLEAVVSVLVRLDEHSALSRESLETILVNQNNVASLEIARVGVATAFELGLIVQVEDQISLSKLGIKLVRSADNNNQKALAHFVLLEILTRIRRDLLWIGSVDAQTIKETDVELFEAMKDTGLFARKLTGSAELFWGKIKSLGLFTDTAAKKIVIGRDAEERSLEYEVQRLIVLRRLDLAQKVAIVSQNTLLGYDVLSFRPDSAGNSSPLRIEVKKMSYDGKNHFFFLTKNEATQARTFLDEYVFHLWPSLENDVSPIVVPAEKLLGRLPLDEFPGQAEWTVCKVWANDLMT